MHMLISNLARPNSQLSICFAWSQLVQTIKVALQLDPPLNRPTGSHQIITLVHKITHNLNKW